MTTTDRAEIRQMLTDILSGHTEEMKGRFNVIHTNLIQIKEQTTKTNGRVTSLENEMETVKREELLHVVNCPVIGRVKSLEEKELSRKAVVKFLLLIGGISGGIAGLIVGVLQIFIKG
jgi:hypothetical protein